VIAITQDPVDEPATGVMPWVLLVVSDERKRRSARSAWERAGFAVEVATSAVDAVECLMVMTPSLVVIDEWVYRPVTRSA